MFKFYVKILSIIFCLFLGSTKAAITNDSTSTSCDNPNAKVELLIKAMHDQGYSDKEILERLQKIENKPNKKHNVYLILGTVAVGITVVVGIYLLIKKVQNLTEKLDQANIATSGNKSSRSSQKQELDGLNTQLSEGKQELERAKSLLANANASLNWVSQSNDQFKTVYVANAAAQANAAHFGFITITLTPEQKMALGIA